MLFHTLSAFLLMACKVDAIHRLPPKNRRKVDKNEGLLTADAAMF
ncbi:putative lipoprotein [Brucella thiophenivorans]|uniref:Putative lipoprotein n=1 Tax=Brucella thiophenivorans TaxID=571255 RepID=A0A256FJP4_9HYPH|nr:putative lipoprotein [Brucella thiophenivorans]